MGDIYTEAASMLFGVPEDQVTLDQRKIVKEMGVPLIYGCNGEEGIPSLEDSQVHHFESHGVGFNYNSFLTGEVIISDSEGHRIFIPARAVLDFVAHCYVAPTQIAKIEQMDTESLLGTFVDDPDDDFDEEDEEEGC